MIYLNITNQKDSSGLSSAEEKINLNLCVEIAKITILFSNSLKLLLKHILTLPFVYPCNIIVLYLVLAKTKDFAD